MDLELKIHALKQATEVHAQLQVLEVLQYASVGLGLVRTCVLQVCSHTLLDSRELLPEPCSLQVALSDQNRLFSSTNAFHAESSLLSYEQCLLKDLKAFCKHYFAT